MFAPVEEGGGRDGGVDLGFEDGDEAGFAELLAVFRPEDEGAGGLAVGAERGWHGWERTRWFSWKAREEVIVKLSVKSWHR